MPRTRDSSSTSSRHPPLQERECDKIANCNFEVYICDSVEKGKSIIDEQAQIAAMVFSAYLQVSAMRKSDDKSVH